MLCPFCSRENPDRQRLCLGCQATLPRIPDLGLDRVGVGWRDDVTYPEPTHHYRTPQLDRLSALIEGLLAGEDLFGELDDHLYAMSTNYMAFIERHVQQMETILAGSRGVQPDDPYPLQLTYLLQRGSELFEQGGAAFDRFFDTESDDPQELEAAFAVLRDSHDYFCLALELAATRWAALEQLLERGASVAEADDLDDDEEWEWVEVEVEEELD